MGDPSAALWYDRNHPMEVIDMNSDRTAPRHPLDYAYTGTDVLYRDFQVSDQGYSEEQADRNRAQYGKNVLSSRSSDTVAAVS